MIDAKEMKQRLKGGWERVLLALAPELLPAIEKAPRHVPCPVHGGNDGFRLFKNWQEDGGGICNSCGTFPDGFALIGWLRGWSFKETLHEVAQVLSGGALPAVTRRPTPVAAGQDSAALKERLKKIYLEAHPLAEPEAEAARRYLRRRHIQVYDVPGLRLHPALPYYQDGQEIDRYPAIVAVFKDPSGRGVTLHRIYLTPEGKKAPVPAPKKTMPVPQGLSLSGAAIRLGPAGPVLGIAEGIETALAVMTATGGQPCWATTSACLLEKVVLPEVVRRVIIWADNDQSKTGLKAAARLAERLVKEGRKVSIRLPQRPAGKKTWDWADVLATVGTQGFSRYQPRTRTRHTVDRIA